MKRFAASVLRPGLLLMAIAPLQFLGSIPIESGAAEPEDSQAITWHAHVQPLMNRTCGDCHNSVKRSAPFSLSTYEQVRKRAEQIVEVTQSRYMPPWLPSNSDVRFKHDRSLKPAEVSMISSWVRNGTPEGQPTEAAAHQRPATPTIESARWKLGEPDLILKPREPYELHEDGAEVFWNFVLPVSIETLKYVEAIEILPGNYRAVHHIVGFVDRTGSSRRRELKNGGFEGMEFGAAEIPASPSMLWSPGKEPAMATTGISWDVDSQTDIILQMHLFPTGKKETVHPEIGFHFAPQPPTGHPVSIMLEAANIDIPAGGATTVTDRFELPVEVQLLSLYPHAHYLGKSVRLTATLPGGKSMVLLNIDDWDFNWQDEYKLAAAHRLPPKTILEMTWAYDNSADNVRNPNSPPRRVELGNRSTDEMGSLLVQVLCQNAADQEKLDESRWKQKLLALPQHTIANQNLGNLYESRGDHVRALQHYRRVVDVTPRDSTAHNNLAATLAAIGDDKLAERHFRLAIQLNPENALAHNDWGATLMRTGRVDEAITKLEKALQIWPNFPEARVNLGEAELRRGDAVAAVKHFQTAAKESPNYALAHFNLGTVLMSQQRFAEAEQSFRNAARCDADFAAAFNNLGISLYQQQKLKDAADQFRRSIEIDPTYDNPRRNLQVVLQQLQAAQE